MTNEVEQFYKELRHQCPSDKLRFSRFPSGAVMLDVPIGSETYVLEYLPSFKAFGVSKASTATFGWEGVENSFENFESAKAYLRGLLQAAGEKGGAEKRGQE